MLRRLGLVVPIQRGEWRISLLMFFYIFGVMGFYYILKPLRYGLFLTDLDSRQLPYAYFLTAICAGTLATLVFKLSRRFSVITLLTASNLAIIVTLFFFRYAMGRQISFMPYFFYVYVQIVSVVSTAQFWLLAGYIYDSRQAKRIYGFLGAGAIAGAMAGSLVVAFLRSWLTTESLLLICVLVCGALIAMSLAAWRYRLPSSGAASRAQRHQDTGTGFLDLSRLAFGSRHLFLLVLLTFLTLIASQIADWQVNAALEERLEHLPKQEMKEALDEFWGRFFLATNVVGILFQLTLTRIVVSRFGIGAAITLLPLSLFITSGGVFFDPSLTMTVLALGSNSVFRYSVNRAGFELLYLPLLPEVRKKIKMFIDVFIDRFGRAVGGVIILLFLATSSPLAIRGTAITIMVLTGMSLVVAIGLRKTYVESFRQQLMVRGVDLEAIPRYITDRSSVNLLVNALESSQERQILYSLRLLQSVRGVDFSPQLLPLLDHPSAFVRQEALNTLAALPGQYKADAETLLKDPVEAVRQAAVAYLCSIQTPAEIQALLSHENVEVRLAAALCVASVEGSSLRPSLDVVHNFLQFEGEHASRARAAAAQLAARLPKQQSVEVLRELLKDADAMVGGAAARAAAAAGHLELVLDIVPMLTRTPFRPAAREALVDYGERICGILGDLLSDPERDVTIKQEIPWILGRIPIERSADILTDHLGVDDTLLKYRIVKALNRIHQAVPALPRPRPAIAQRVYTETKSYYQALALCRVLVADGEKNGRKLLARALKERLDQNLEIIFRLLGLQYPQRDIYFAYTALKGARADRRAAAIEFLDNLLHKNLKSIILPLLEESSIERLIDRANRLFGIQKHERNEALKLILGQRDSWLKVCALHRIGDERILELKDMAQSLAEDKNPLVRETAQWALQRCA